jgi:hypothetical protein
MARHVNALPPVSNWSDDGGPVRIIDLRCSEATQVGRSGDLTHVRHMPAVRISAKSLTRTDMADNELEILTNARAVLLEVRRDCAKAIAAGYKRGETETAIKSIIEVQHALDVIDHATEELEDVEDDEDED